tara:strand:- start:812 stop:1405 length:594 start_codon:yes stop_codon:yes gene_type:complete
MSKKEFTKKQLKKQLTILTEGKGDIKSELKKAYKALKKLKQMLIGHKTGEDTLSFSDLKKIKTAARHIEDIYEDMVDTEMTEKEEKESRKVEKKNEQSEGHGKMYNALSGIKEGKVIKMNESTLKRIVGRVIKESDWMQGVEKDIEKRGTEGVFHKWCDEHGYDGGCDSRCWTAAKREGGVWGRRAGLAKAFCESRK